MINFNEMRALRDKLVESLVLWGRGSSDGFYRSSPTSHSTPSFTNTGMVLQAFLESRNFHLAHDLAERMIAALRTKYKDAGIFPHEKAQSLNEGHTMCNAWASFALLDTFPNRVADVVGICDWFLESQSASEGYWSLFPAEETKEPIVTGYAVSAMQQFHQCCRQLKQLGRSSPCEPTLIGQKIELAISYLLDSRPQAIKEQRLYLWTASINSDDSRKPLSLGTSALCMHVLSKWGRYRGRPELVDGVTATFKELLSGFQGSSSHYLEIRGQRLALWDQLHFNEGKVHYLWNFFAPVSLVTLMGLAERSELMGDPDLLRFMVRFSLWISDHVCPAGGGTVGVSGGESLAEPKVWSTAQSVIVLSRILDRRHLFMMKPQGEASDRAIISEFSAPLFASDRSDELGKPLAAETVGVAAHSVDVFISYAMEDKEQARHLAEVLGSRNVSYFLSEKNVKPGDNWVDEIKRALRDCKVLYSLVTPSSLGSEWAQIEWNVASFLEKKIVPVLLHVSVSDLPERLRSYQSVDFHRISELPELEMLQRQ